MRMGQCHSGIAPSKPFCQVETSIQLRALPNKNTENANAIVPFLPYLTISYNFSHKINKHLQNIIVKLRIKHYIFWPNLSPFETSWDNQTPLPTTEFPWISGSGGNTSGSGAGASSSEGAKGGASGSSWRMNGSMTSCLPWDSFPTIKNNGCFLYNHRNAEP